MTDTTPRIFDRIRAGAASLCSTSRVRRRFHLWADHEPALAGVDPDVVLRRYRPEETCLVNQRLAALLRLSASEPLAGELLIAAVSPGLAAVANALSRSWRASIDEVDQVVAVAAWARIRRLAGQSLEWPATVVVDGARREARAALAAGTRHHQRPGELRPVSEPDAGPGGVGEEATSLLRVAIGRGLVSPEAAGLVYSTRVLGFRLGELAGPGRPESTLRVQRWRAERALRVVA